jgi:hypothetical protein
MAETTHCACSIGVDANAGGPIQSPAAYTFLDNVTRLFYLVDGDHNPIGNIQTGLFETRLGAFAHGISSPQRRDRSRDCFHRSTSF